MSKWWALRLTWLALGLLTGVIGILPDAAAMLTAMLALVYIAASAALLGRWVLLEFGSVITAARKKTDPHKVGFSTEIFPGASLEFEASKAGSEKLQRPKSGWILSGFRAAGLQFKTQIRVEEQTYDPRKSALVWDSALFLGAVVACAGLLSLIN